MDTTATQHPTELERFETRNNDRLVRDAAITSWHVSLHLAAGVELPWSGSDQWIGVNVGEYDDNKYIVNEEETVKKLAKIIKYASSQSFAVEKKYTDDQFRAIVTISEEPKVKVTYSADRNVVCEPTVIGQKVIPAEVIPAKVIDEVEWTCTKLSFLGIDTE